MSKHSTLSPTLLNVLRLAQKKKKLTPDEINNHIGKGNYASKHILYLKILGYEFDTVRDGRNIAYYSLVKEPDNSDELIDGVNIRKKKSATKKYRKALLNVIEKKKEPAEIKAKVKVPKKVENKNKKSVAEIKAANLSKLKTVAVASSQENDSFSNGSSFDIDSGWDEFTISRDELKYIL